MELVVYAYYGAVISAAFQSEDEQGPHNSQQIGKR